MEAKLERWLGWTVCHIQVTQSHSLLLVLHSMMLPLGAGRHYCQINSKTKGHPSIFFYFLVFLIGFEYGSSHLSCRYLSRKLIDYGILWNVEIHLETLSTGSWLNGWADDLEMYSRQLQSMQQVSYNNHWVLYDDHIYCSQICGHLKEKWSFILTCTLCLVFSLWRLHYRECLLKIAKCLM